MRLCVKFYIDSDHASALEQQAWISSTHFANKSQLLKLQSNDRPPIIQF